MSERFVCVVYRQKMVGIEQGSFEYKQFSSSWNLLQLHLSFAWFFFFFNDHLFIWLFILASVAFNSKTATESDMLNNIAGVLKYVMTKLVLGWWKDSNEWDWIFEYLRTWTTLYENGLHYGTTIQFCSNFPHKYTTLISTIGFP